MTRCRKIEFFPDITSFVPLGKNEGNIVYMDVNLRRVRSYEAKGY